MYKSKEIKCMKADDPSGLVNVGIWQTGESVYARHFVVMPVKILDYSDTASVSNIEERHDKAVYVEEDCFFELLFMYVFHYLDKDIRENKNRGSIFSNETHDKNLSFEICGIYNFFTHEHIKDLIEDLKNSIWKFNDTTIEFFSKFIESLEEMIEWSKANDFSLISIHAVSINSSTHNPGRDYLQIFQDPVNIE